MNRCIGLCLLSAVIGGLVATAISQRLDSPTAAAQDVPSPARRRGAPGGPVRLPAADGPARGYASDVVPASWATGFTPDEQVNIAVYENVNRCVVNISTKSSTDAFFVFELYSEGAGSGAILDHEGHVLTNFHVVDSSQQVQVTLFDGKTYEAKLVGGDETTDLAVLKIEAPRESLYPVVLGESSSLLVGQRVFALGNPFGLERTLTTGIISSLNRSLPARNGRTMKSIIQIDAAINPGNSGGPLLDTHSRLIGVNTAIASATGQNTGVGFAIPVNTIARVVPQLIAQGRVIRPDVGIAKVYQTEQGLLVASLTPGGPAEKAGLRGPKIVRERRRKGPFVSDYQKVDRSAADLIVGVDGTPIKTADEFLTLIESRKPHEQTVLTVVREGTEVQVAIVLAPGE